MKKTVQFIAMGVIVIMSLALFSGCVSNYGYKEGDFKLTIELDKTEVNFGDTIMVTAKLENLSGQNVIVQTKHPFKELKNMILMGLFREDDDHVFAVEESEGKSYKMTIKKDAIVIQIASFVIEDSVDYQSSAFIFFYVGKNGNERIEISSNIVKIKGVK